MKRLQELTRQISELTVRIEQEYPELYRHLDENPLTLPGETHQEIDTHNLSDYLDSLKHLLEHRMKKGG